ncbi:sensor histidine kinase [Methylovorus sp. MM2]|uniref:sensor histidine kinase n=1 Tax=Methylovorus sp. MM2 TaxID=1848038 RepID=UPI0009EEEA49|nr:sensor histidine kinase [Methylovorus sp. MM2]
MLKKALPIHHIMVGAFLLAGLLPSVLITGLAFYEARDALRTEIQRYMESQAAAASDEIDRMMLERMQNIASWSNLEVMQDVRIGDIDKRLSKFLDNLKISYGEVYRELYVIDTQGIVVASSNPNQIGMKIRLLDPWLSTNISKTNIRLSKLQYDRIPISVNIPDLITGESAGTLVAIFNWEQVHRVLESAASARGGSALIDAEGNVLSSTSRWEKTLQAKKLTANAVSNGYQGFSGFNWHVSIIQNRAQALTPVRHMAYIFIGLLVLSVLLAMAIAVPVATAITNPLAKLTRFASGFMRTQNELAPQLGGPEEINQLSQAFNKMISDLELSKENLTRAAKLAVAGEMAAAMSHEVRTPLGILRSSAQVLLREPNLSQEGKEVCGFIINETERLNKLVSTLIDSARPRTPELLPTDLSEIAQQSVAMLRMQAQKKNISLTCDSPAQISALCDAEQITQVLLNLILNAIQILPENGKILVSIAQSMESAVIIVADNGPGVTPEQRTQIFDPFFTQRAGGVGLGLAVARQIVLAHHGTINVSSSKMEGAEFRITLPMLAQNHTHEGHE